MRLRFLSLLSLLLVSTSCISLPRQLQKKTSPDFSAFKVLGNNFELHYGGETVGRASYKKDVVWFSDKDFDTQHTLIEDFSYRGTHYRFIFIMVGELKSIGYLKYNHDMETFRDRESLLITLEKDYVKHNVIAEDGKTLKGERIIGDELILNQTRDLFAFCNHYLNNYFTLLANVDKRNKLNNRAKSLGYELLKYDRI